MAPLVQRGSHALPTLSIHVKVKKERRYAFRIEDLLDGRASLFRLIMRTRHAGMMHGAVVANTSTS